MSTPEPRFRVTAPDFKQSCDRWIDALEVAKARIPSCKGWFQEVRIFDQGELVWVCDRWHSHPQFIGPGTYKRLALLFLQETEPDADPSPREPDQPQNEQPSLHLSD